MLSEFFGSASRIQELREGQDGHLLDGFAQELCQAGYAKITARRHIRAAEHLIYWVNQQGGSVATLDERIVEKFVGHLNLCRCPRYGHTHLRDLRNGAGLFLRYARVVDFVTTQPVEQIIVDPALLVSFCGWMRKQRGTCDATLYSYRSHVRDLLKSVGEDPSRFDAQSLRQFVLDTSKRCDGRRRRSAPPLSACFCAFSLLGASVRQDWTPPSPFWHTGGFLPCQGICNPMKSSG
jgi:integrase/recombinase XerD